MMTIDRLDSKLEKIIDMVQSLSFDFKDANLSVEAEEAKKEAVAALENFQELAGQDWEESPDSTNEEDP